MKTLGMQGIIMIQFAIAFLVIALVAGFFGFYTVEHTAVGIAKIIFFICVVLFLLSLFNIYL